MFLKCLISPGAAKLQVTYKFQNTKIKFHIPYFHGLFRDMSSFLQRVISIVIALGVFQVAFAQEIATDFWPARHLAILHDFGYNWSTNTVFKPYRWERVWNLVQNDDMESNSGLDWIIQDMVEETNSGLFSESTSRDTLNLRWWNGLLLKQPVGKGGPFPEFSGSPFSKLTFWFKQKLSLQLYLRMTNDPTSLQHFTGRPREIRRFGLNAAEFDYAALSYHNNWLTVQFGRGRQAWGAFESNNLVLSSNSPAYEHLMLEARYKRYKGRFFYGFLESIMANDSNINRYLVGHAIEYSNHRNLLIGFSELIIFSGIDRPLDLSFLNPFLPAIEVELNDRTNKQVGPESSNAVWSLLVDWMVIPGLRVSANFTIDEFQFDNKDREKGRPDAIAYHLKTAYSKTIGSIGVTTFFDYSRIGTFTFSHFQSSNNFVSRGLPIGSELGNDSDRLQLGVRLLLPIRVIFSSSFGIQRSGERNLLNNPYLAFSEEEFQAGPFPSGTVQKTHFIDWRINYSVKKNIEIDVSGRFSSMSGPFNDNQNYLVFSINTYLPWWFGF